MSESVVAKFGGTSMAQPELVANIVESRPEQQIIVVSAPGIAPGFDEKMTDRLIGYGKTFINGSYGSPFRDEIIDRFDGLYSMLEDDDRAKLRDFAARQLRPSYSQLSGD